MLLTIPFKMALVALWTVLGMLSLHAVAAAEEPFRIFTPAGNTRHPAVLFVPGCSGFVAANGTKLYEERAAELQAAGYIVVFVDYIGRRMQSNCAHVSQAEVSANILEAVTWVRQRTDVDRGANIGHRLVIWWRRRTRGTENDADSAHVHQGRSLLPGLPWSDAVDGCGHRVAVVR